MKFILVTGATGSDALGGCLQSVAKLEPVDDMTVEHWVVADGEDKSDAVRRVCDSVPVRDGQTRRLVVLPYNTGRDGGTYLCHRIIAATSFMVPTGSWVQNLDEDTRVRPHHVRAISTAMKTVADARWGYTLRLIVDPVSGETVPDVVESMGLIRTTCLGPPDRLVDTNCYVMHSSLAKELAPLWGTTTARNPEDVEADRKVALTLASHEPRAWCTRDWTVEYQVANRPDSVNMSFFKHAKALPWSSGKRDLYVFHFSAEHTLACIDATHPKHLPLGEWCPTMLDGLRDSWNLLNGFECLNALPHDAVCWISLCHPDTLPLRELRGMKMGAHQEMVRILYTAEGPNVRHQSQWTASFLAEACDVVLTHNMHILDMKGIKTMYCPHNSRFLSPATVSTVCRDNASTTSPPSAAMVLEPRGTKGSYMIDGIQYESLDYLRKEIACSLASEGIPTSVVGRGWNQIVTNIPEDARPTVVYDIPRHLDSKTSVDTLVHHDVALILENCACPGYVSEKVGDALIAGCVPLYDGRNVVTREGAGDLELLDQGRNVWWLDLRDPEGVIDALRNPGRLQELKANVLKHREAYLLAKGTNAIRNALINFFSL